MKDKIYKLANIDSDMIFPGSPFGLPDDNSALVFIDGAYLLRLKNSLFKNKKYNLKKFILNKAKKAKIIVRKIFFYDAPPFQKENNIDRKNKSKKISYNKFISSIKKQGIIVREGRTQRVKFNKIFIYKQKGVDMLLGIDMISMINDYSDIKIAILLTGDSDFVPVVNKLKENNIKSILWTYFDKKRDSPFSKCNELIKHVSEVQLITKYDFEQSVK